MFTSERERAGSSIPRPRKVVLTLRSCDEVHAMGTMGPWGHGFGSTVFIQEQISRHSLHIIRFMIFMGDRP